MLFSCDPNRVYEDNANLHNGIWRADSAKFFHFRIDNPNLEYNIYFNVRNGIEFPHSNLYIKYILQDSIGHPLEEELKNVQLFQPKSGYPLGSGTGDLFEHQFNLLKNYHFSSAGKYYLGVEQFMRYDSLPEIYSVGIRIEKCRNIN